MSWFNLTGVGGLVAHAVTPSSTTPVERTADFAFGLYLSGSNGLVVIRPNDMLG